MRHLDKIWNVDNILGYHWLLFKLVKTVNYKWLRLLGRIKLFNKKKALLQWHSKLTPKIKCTYMRTCSRDGALLCVNSVQFRKSDQTLRLLSTIQHFPTQRSDLIKNIFRIMSVSDTKAYAASQRRSWVLRSLLWLAEGKAFYGSLFNEVRRRTLLGFLILVALTVLLERSTVFADI